MGRKGRGTETEIPEGSGTSWHMTVTAHDTGYCHPQGNSFHPKGALKWGHEGRSFSRGQMHMACPDFRVWSMP